MSALVFAGWLYSARDHEGSALAPCVDDDMKRGLMSCALAEADRQGREKGEMV